MLKVWIGLLVVSVVGLFTWGVMSAFNDDFNAYGEVPIPGSQRLNLPAGDVTVSLHAEVPNENYTLPNLQNLELLLTAPNGNPQPSVTDQLGEGAIVNESDAHWPVKVVHTCRSAATRLSSFCRCGSWEACSRSAR